MDTRLQLLASDDAPTETDLTGENDTIACAPGAGAYADRPYERRLAENGRKIVSLDLDSDLVSRIDALRGDKRRGLQIDALLRRALSMEIAA